MELRFWPHPTPADQKVPKLINQSLTHSIKSSNSRILSGLWSRLRLHFDIKLLINMDSFLSSFRFFVNMNIAHAAGSIYSQIKYRSTRFQCNDVHLWVSVACLPHWGTISLRNTNFCGGNREFSSLIERFSHTYLGTQSVNRS